MLYILWQKIRNVYKTNANMLHVLKVHFNQMKQKIGIFEWKNFIIREHIFIKEEEIIMISFILHHGILICLFEENKLRSLVRIARAVVLKLFWLCNLFEKRNI